MPDETPDLFNSDYADMAKALLDAGVNPYPIASSVNAYVADLAEDYADLEPGGIGPEDEVFHLAGRFPGLFEILFRLLQLFRELLDLLSLFGDLALLTVFFAFFLVRRFFRFFFHRRLGLLRVFFLYFFFFHICLSFFFRPQR